MTDFKKMHFSTAIIVLVLSNFVVCDNDHGSHAVSYDANSFKEAVSTNKNFVMFYAPWCGHCKNLAPTWDELAKVYNSKEDSPVVISKVDCTIHTQLCSDQEIVGFPTLKLFPVGGSEPKRYSGRRDLDSLKTFLMQQLNEPAPEAEDAGSEGKGAQMDNGVVVLTDDNFQETVSDGLYFIKFYAPWCGHCKRLAPTWHDLAKSLELDDTVTIAKIDCDANPVACNKQNVRGYPTLLVFKEGEQLKSYDSDRSLAALQGFVKREIKTLLFPEEEEEEEEEMVGDEVDMEVEAHEPGKVKELTADNYVSFMSDKLVFVKFYAPWCGHCKRLAPTWDDLAKALEEESVSIAKVDCTMHKSVCDDNQVRGYPTLKIFRDGVKLEDYRQSRSLESLTTFVNGHLVAHDEL